MHFYRERFQREASVLSELRDPNVAQVIGVCSDVEPMCMVLEYSIHGDLTSYLQDHIPEGSTGPVPTKSKILR